MGEVESAGERCASARAEALVARYSHVETWRRVIGPVEAENCW